MKNNKTEKCVCRSQSNSSSNNVELLCDLVWVFLIIKLFSPILFNQKPLLKKKINSTAMLFFPVSEAQYVSGNVLFILQLQGYNMSLCLKQLQIIHSC